VNVTLKGVTALGSKTVALTLAANPEDTNSITEPRKVIPVETTLRALKPTFIYSMPPHSIVVLKLKTHS
jgi:alpha-N-arabinofuranosidase